MEIIFKWVGGSKGAEESANSLVQGVGWVRVGCPERVRRR